MRPDRVTLCALAAALAAALTGEPFAQGTPAATPGIASPAPEGILSLLKRYFRLTFVVGPKILLTSRISGKCAALMFMLCSPSLLFCMVLTVPALLFKSPQQNAYFYFSTTINQDPSRWAVLVLAAICAILALAVPATMSPPRSSVGSY